MPDDREQSKKEMSDMPNEVIAEVAKYLYSDDPNQASRDAKNFRLVNKRFNAAIENMPAAKSSHDRINRLGKMALAIYDAVVPKDELHAESAEQPGDTYTHVAIANWVLKFRPPLERKELVNKVLDVSDRWAIRTEASIPLVDSRYVEPKDRNKLINNAILSLERDRKDNWEVRDETLKEPAQRVLIQANESGYLADAQKEKLPAGTLDIPKPNIWGMDDRPHFDRGVAFKERTEHDIEPVRNVNDLDKNIDSLDNELHELLPALPALEDHSREVSIHRTEILECLEIVAEHVSSAYDDTRRLLLENDHRVSSGRDRPQLDERQRSGRAE